MKTVYSFQSIFSEFKKSMNLSLPLIGANFVYALNGFIATVMVAKLGSDELAASGLVWSTFLALILFFIGILNAVGILVAQSYGAKDDKGIEITTKQGFILAILFSIPMMMIMWIAPYFLYWTGQTSKIIAISIPYFHSLGWCMLPLSILIIMEQFLTGITKTRWVLIMSLLEVPIELFCFYIFVFGKLGLPKFGLPGIGYGFFVGTFILVIIIGLIIHFSEDSRKYKLFTRWWLINKKYLVELFRVGLPIGGMYCIEVALFAAIVYMMGVLGEKVLAAHNLAMQFLSFTISIIFALAQGASIRAGNEVGANNRDALKLSALVNMGMGFVFMLIIAIFYIGIPKYLLAIDIDVNSVQNKTLVKFATEFLVIAGVLQLSDCLRITCVSVLRGLKDTKVPMYISIIGFWLIAFPMAYLLGFVFHFGGQGIWWGVVIGLAASALMLVFRLKSLVNKLDLTALVTRQNLPGI